MDWPLLSSLPDAERDAVLGAARQRRYARGEVVFHEAEPADAMHLVVSGHLAVRIGTPDGGTSLLNVLGPGDVVGELSLLPGRPGATRSASVHCLDDVVTHVLGASAFAALCDRHPGVERWLTGVLAERVAELSVRVRDLMLVDLDQRVRSCLHDLLSRFAGRSGPHPVIPLTQDQLAEFVGATRPSVNQVLQQLAAEGVVQVGRGRVVVLRPEALESGGLISRRVT